MKKNIYYLIPATILLFAYCSSENGDWKKVKRQNNVQAYEQFIKSHPQSIYIDSANFEIKEILYPTGVVVALPSMIIDAQEAMSGTISTLNFEGNTIRVKLRDTNIVEAIATKEQLEAIFMGKKNVTLKKTDDNQWNVFKLEESKTEINKTKTDTIK